MSKHPTTHRARVTRAIELGRQRDRPAIAALIAGGAAARWQAAAATFGDRDGARALALLADPSRRVRGLATVVAPLACDDAQAVAALHGAWATRRERHLLRRMAAHGRTVAIDRFLDDLAAAGHARELIDALPFGSPAVVRRHLAIALERPSVRLWAGLAGHHPALLAEILGARWAAHPGEADPLTRQLTAAHHVLIADRDPERGLALAELLLARGIEPGLAVWQPLLRRRPEAAVALAIRFAARLPAGLFAARARHLAPALLADIMAEAPTLLGDGTWIRQASPDRQQALAAAWLRTAARWPTWGAWLLCYLPADEAREAAYQLWSTAARGHDGAIDAALLTRLPSDLAAREGRRHLMEVVALATDAAARLAGRARYLPWTELEAAIAGHLGHPDGTVRALALRELLAVPGVYPDDASLPAQALALVVARKFEQDPVRQAMFETLARWPRRVWRAEHLPAVAQALRDMLDAADCSSSTARAAEQLVIRLIAVDATWAATWFATLIKERGVLYDPRLGAKLTDADLAAAGPGLLAIARTWIKQERLAWLALFADSLGRRLQAVPGLVDAVVLARDGAVHEWDALALTKVLAAHAPTRHLATLAGAIARLRKRSWWSAVITLAVEHGQRPGQQVRQRARRRPDLPSPLADALVEVIGTAPPEYKEAAADALYRRAPDALDAALPRLLKADESLIRLTKVRHWLHRHRQDLLAPFLAGKRVTGKFATGASIWVLSFDRGTFRWTADDASAYARSLGLVIGDHERDTPMVLTALATLAEVAWADQAALCAYATDERAAVKEKAIRVLARCDAGQGVPTLLACLADARARFAIYGLRRALFELAPVRAVELLAAAPMAKVTVAKEVVRLLGELRTPAAVARLDALAAGTLHRDVRIALLRALWDHLDRPETWAIFERAVVDPDWITASRLADIPADRLTVDTDRRLAALLARIIARPEPEARIALLGRAGTLAVVDRERTFLAACRARLASVYDDEVNAAMGAMMWRSTERDVAELGAAFTALCADPRALHVAGATLVRHDVRARASWQAVARALADVAAGDPRWAALAVTATGALVDPTALAAMLARLAAQGALDHDALVAAGPAVAAIRDEDRAALGEALAASPHAAVRRVAVMALIADAGPGRGWTPPRLAALAALRADPSPQVAGAAARVWPPREDDPGFG